MPDDKSIIDNVRAALADEPRVHHAAEIAVSSRDGWVSLRGTVRSLPQRTAAVEVAKWVEGVRGVEDQLRLDVRDRWEDSEVRGAALQALIADEHVPAERVDVDVADGWLTLTGEVKRQTDSDAAFHAVSRVAGVGGITNEIKVITAGIDG